MVRRLLLCLIAALYCELVPAAETKERIRPITEAESVLAVYQQDWGLASSGEPEIILAAWPDGYVVWSKDRVNGGPPYFSGRTDPEKITALLSRFEKEGLFAHEELEQAHFGPDSSFITVLVKSGPKQCEMCSWHELMEASDHVADGDRGAVAIEGRRLDELRKQSPDYLFFRTVWSETRAKLSELIPGNGVPDTGRPVMKAGVLSWAEGAATEKPKGVGEPGKK